MRRQAGRRTALAALAAAVLVLAGCGGAAGGRGGTDRGGDQGSGELTVFAAASLTEAFTELGRDFGAANPGARVRFSFAASSALARQLNQGAPADVFAAASPATMRLVADAGGVAGQSRVFARNVLQLAVPRGNPGGVRGLADLGRPELRIALCAEQVPCGAAARTALGAAGVAAAPDTLEQDVKAALAKVTLGEVDAALVYRTDVLAAGDAVEGIPFAGAELAANDYPVAALAGSRDPAAAAAFVEFVLSPAGRARLSAAGFETP